MHHAAVHIATRLQTANYAAVIMPSGGYENQPYRDGHWARNMTSMACYVRHMGIPVFHCDGTVELAKSGLDEEASGLTLHSDQYVAAWSELLESSSRFVRLTTMPTVFRRRAEAESAWPKVAMPMPAKVLLCNDETTVPYTLTLKRKRR